jgi:uncharacterized protein (DUF427 family)
MANPAPGFKKHPDHKITVRSRDGRVRVTSGDLVLAETQEALELSEANYPPVLYIPFSDIDFGALTRTATTTHCPFKGEATYWQVGLPGDLGQDVMWAYERPFDEMAEIAGHGAFYADRVKVEVE